MALAVSAPRIVNTSRLRAQFGITIFVGAFLLFQMQPMVGKYVLPWFGGMPAVWTTCLLFFQVLLLGGYLYSHALSAKLEPRMQWLVHSIAAGAAVTVLAIEVLLWRIPLLPGSYWKPISPDHPVRHLLLLLTVSVGLPYMLLCTTGPLLQSWISSLDQGRSPYRLYALSNLGSLLGLITYPIVFEPFFGLRSQAWLWTIGYVIFAAGSMLCATYVRNNEPATSSLNEHRSPYPERSSPAVPSISTQCLWFLLAAFASLMLLATTNIICQDIAVIPFLWIVPLALYLISLIICFDNPRWYRRDIFHILFAITLLFVVLALFRPIHSKPVLMLVGIFILHLFAACMVCHGELVKQRPHPAYLTRFYLLVAAGGAAGGIFVALVAPRIFSGYWEFQFGVVGCVTLIMLVLARDKDSWWYWNRWSVGALILLGLAATPHLYVKYMEFLLPPDAFYSFHYYGLLSCFMAGTVFLLFRERKQPAIFRKLNLVQAASILVLLALAAAFVQQIRAQQKDAVRRDRNFYGSLTIYSRVNNQYRVLVLVHGQTSHGYQILNEPRKPTLYYGHHSGLGRLMGARPDCNGLCQKRYGVIGLGVGAISAYGRPGETFRYYEINPQVISYSAGANPYFTFVRDSAAKIEVVPGDARLSLERELKEHGSNRFDMLIVDAFNSDSIPVHLLTREMFSTYLAHLRSPDSVLVFHVSNRALNLHPVLAGLAAENHLACVRVHRDTSMEVEELSDWVMMSRNPKALDVAGFKGHIAPMPPANASVHWTDDYSNLFRLIKFRDK